MTVCDEITGAYSPQIHPHGGEAKGETQLHYILLARACTYPMQRALNPGGQTLHLRLLPLNLL